jgi:hypothetical protein
MHYFPPLFLVWRSSPFRRPTGMQPELSSAHRASRSAALQSDWLAKWPSGHLSPFPHRLTVAPVRVRTEKQDQS